VELASRSSAIIDGQPTSDYAAVGELFAGQLGGVGQYCTATLVGEKTVLTAAHCLDLSQPHTFTLAGGLHYTASRVVAHKDWRPGDPTLPNDIGLVILNKAPQVEPARISTRAPFTGLELKLVGFGETSEGRRDVGTKRIATNHVYQTETKRFLFAGTGGGTGSTCHGDSGGPAFATIDGAFVQIGVTSAGYSPCGTMGFDTRVDAYVEWIRTNSEGDVREADYVAPQVTIVSPGNGAKVPAQFTLEAQATDNMAVKTVEVLIDATQVSSLAAPPYSFNLTAASTGAHTVKVIAKDDSGNEASAQITINVEEGTVPDPGMFGAVCVSAPDCKSNICASANSVYYCTQACSLGGEVCPQGADCINAGGDTFVCGPPKTGAGFDGLELLGGCAVNASDAPSHLPWLLLLFLFFARRRR